MPDLLRKIMHNLIDKCLKNLARPGKNLDMSRKDHARFL